MRRRSITFRKHKSFCYVRHGYEERIVYQNLITQFLTLELKISTKMPVEGAEVLALILIILSSKTVG